MRVEYILTGDKTVVNSCNSSDSITLIRGQKCGEKLYSIAKTFDVGLQTSRYKDADLISTEVPALRLEEVGSGATLYFSRPSSSFYQEVVVVVSTGGCKQRAKSDSCRCIIGGMKIQRCGASNWPGRRDDFETLSL